jgi:hypothetical protein
MVEVLKKERLKMKEDRRVLAMMISCREWERYVWVEGGE